MKCKFDLLLIIVSFFMIPSFSYGQGFVASNISTGLPLHATPLSCVSVVAAPQSGAGAYYAAANFTIDTSNCHNHETDNGLVFTVDLSSATSIQPYFSTTVPALQFSTITPWATWPALFVPSNDVYPTNNNLTVSVVLPYAVQTGQIITIGLNLNNATQDQINQIFTAINGDHLATVYSVSSIASALTVNDGVMPSGFSQAAYPSQYPHMTLQWCSNYNSESNACSAWVTAGQVTFTSWNQNWSAYGLPYGYYSLLGDPIDISNGAVFSPLSSPLTFTLSPFPGTTKQMAYIQTQNASGSVNITLPAQPSGSNVPAAVIGYLTDHGSGDTLASIPSLAWGSTTSVPNLAPSETFGLTFNPIIYVNAAGTGLEQTSLTPSPSSFTPTSQGSAITVSSSSASVPSWTASFILQLPAKISNQSVQMAVTSNAGSLVEQLTASNAPTPVTVVVPGASSAAAPGTFSIPNIYYTIGSQAGYLIPSPQTGSISSANTTVIKYTYFTIPQVQGWPVGHVDMGNLTGDGGVESEGLTDRQSAIDALFKYAGSNGAGDRGQVWPPAWTYDTVQEAKALSTSKGKPVIPVMVEYTAQMSGGTSYDDVNSQETVAMHFTNLAFDANDVAYSVKNEGLAGGSFVLNPDLFGMIAQNSLESDIDNSFTNNPINIQQAVASACCMVAKYPEPGIRSLGKNQITDFGTCFQSNQPTTCVIPATGQTVSIPNFASGTGGVSTFADWVAANNWIADNFGGSKASYGWMMNIWSADNKQHLGNSVACATASANWLHFATGATGSGSTVQNCYSNLNIGVLKQYHVYDGFPDSASNPIPNYIAFDKYEMDVIPGAVGIGYLFNDRDWDNYFTAIQQVSAGIALGRANNVPVMLFQMPGGHLRSLNDVDTRTGHISTIPDYIFGDLLLKSDFSGAADVDGYLETSLNDGTYNCAVLGSGACTVRGYLTAQGQDWTQSNMNQLIKSNVFAILWGGGTGPTTSIALYPTDDSGWLAGKILGTLSTSQ